MVLTKIWVDLTLQPDGLYAGSVSKVGQGIAMYSTGLFFHTLHGTPYGTLEDIEDMLEGVRRFAIEHQDASFAQPTPIFFNSGSNIFVINAIQMQLNKDSALASKPPFGIASLAYFSACQLTAQKPSVNAAKFTYKGNDIYVYIPSLSSSPFSDPPTFFQYWTPEFATISTEPTTKHTLSDTETTFTVTQKGYVKAVYYTGTTGGSSTYNKPKFININKNRLQDADTKIVTRREAGTTYSYRFAQDYASYIGYNGLTITPYASFPEYDITLPTTTNDGSVLVEETIQELTSSTITATRVFATQALAEQYSGYPRIASAGFCGRQKGIVFLDPSDSSYNPNGYVLSDRNVIFPTDNIESSRASIPVYYLSILNNFVSRSEGTQIPTVKVLAYKSASPRYTTTIFNIPFSDKYLYDNFKVGLYIQVYNVYGLVGITIRTRRYGVGGGDDDVTLNFPANSSGKLVTGYLEVDPSGIQIRWKTINYSTIPEIVALQQISRGKDDIVSFANMTDGKVLFPLKPTTAKISLFTILEEVSEVYLVLSPKTSASIPSK